MSSLREKMGMRVERESPGRNQGMEAWKSAVNAGNGEQLNVAEGPITLSVVDVFLCLKVPGRVCFSNLGHLPAMADWAEPQPKCSRIYCLIDSNSMA